MRKRTLPNVVIHERNGIQNLGKSRYVFHGISVGTSERSRSNRSRQSCAGQVQAQLLEKQEKVVAVLTVYFVSCISFTSGVLLVEVEPIQLVRVIRFRDILDERHPARGSGYGRGKVSARRFSLEA